MSLPDRLFLTSAYWSMLSLGGWGNALVAIWGDAPGTRSEPDRIAL